MVSSFALFTRAFRGILVSWVGIAEQELARVGCPMAAATPQSKRFSPFAHNPRSCLGKNFAQMVSWQHNGYQSPCHI